MFRMDVTRSVTHPEIPAAEQADMDVTFNQGRHPLTG